MPSRDLTHRAVEVSHLPVPATPATYPAAAADEPVFLITAVRKRWPLLLVCLVVSGVVAAGAAKRFSSQTVESKASMLYSGLPMPPGSAVYKPLSVQTYAALFASQANLHRLIQMHGLETSPVRLEKRILVKPGRSSAKIDVTFTSNDEEQAVQQLDDLMEIFIEEVVRRRSETIDTHIRHTERMLLASTAKVDEAAERRRAYQQREGDALQRQILIERKLETLSAGVESIKTALETAEFKKIGLQTETTALGQRHAELKKSYKRQLLTDIYARYQERLEDYGPKSSARSRLQEAGQQLKALAAAIDEDHDLTEWKLQLLEIDSEIMPASDEYRAGPLEPYERELEKINSRQRDLQLNSLVNEQGIELLKARLAKKETELQEEAGDVSATSDYAEQLEAEFEEANGARLRIQQQLSGLRQLEECRVREFSVATPAYVANAKTSTRKLFVMTLFFMMMALSAPVFAREYFAQQTPTLERTGRKFGLPVLAQGALAAKVIGGRANADSPDVDALRLLALRIQQSISQPGSTVLFSGLEHNESTFPLLCGLAHCFSEREQRVLILDAGKSVVANDQQLESLFGESPQVVFGDRDQAPLIHEGPAPENGSGPAHPAHGAADLSPAQNGNTSAHSGGPLGLSDYLSFDELDSTQMIILPTRLPGVDCICSGRRPFPVEGLATRRMSDLFDHARKHYELVLVAGPPSLQLADLQMLAARRDGILFTTIPGKSLAPHSQDVLQELLDLEAPIIGIVG